MENNTSVECALIKMYQKCSQPNNSLQIWNAMVAGDRAKLINQHTMIPLLTACAEIGPTALVNGQQVHDLIRNNTKLVDNVAVVTSLINMYSRCGKPLCALELWNQVRNSSGFSDSRVLHICTLGACAALGERGLETGKSIHDIIGSVGADIILNNALLRMYTNCGDPASAISVWNDIRKQNNYNDRTLNYVLIACTSTDAEMLSVGQQVHADIMKSTYASNISLQASLMIMYLVHRLYKKALEVSRIFMENKNTPASGTIVTILKTCSSLKEPVALDIGDPVYSKFKTIDAFSVAEKLSITTAAISMYASCGNVDATLMLIRNVMQDLDDATTIDSILLLVCFASLGIVGSSQALDLGTQLHHKLDKTLDYARDVSLFNAIMSMYNKCEEPHEVLAMWSKVNSQPNLEVQTFLYVLHSHNCIFAFLHIFRVVLSACADLTDAESKEIGKRVHEKLKNKKLSSTKLDNALINMYTKHGDSTSALDVYNSMKDRGVEPSIVTYLLIINLCASIGMKGLVLGTQAYNLARSTNNHTDDELNKLQSSAATMFLKCGNLERVLDLWSELPNSIPPGTVLKACAQLKSPRALEIGEQLYSGLSDESLKDDIQLMSALVTMYANCGQAERAQSIWKKMVSFFSDHIDILM